MKIFIFTRILICYFITTNCLLVFADPVSTNGKSDKVVVQPVNPTATKNTTSTSVTPVTSQVKNSTTKNSTTKNTPVDNNKKTEKNVTSLDSSKAKLLKNTKNYSKIIAEIKAQENNIDPLTKRIIIKNLSKEKLPFNIWNDIRIYLLKNPQYGYDLIYKWDNIRPIDVPSNEKENKMNVLIDQADQLMDQQKFNKAFKKYQEVALILKKEIDKGYKENMYLYGAILHSMGRALFGAERFDDAIEVFKWIPHDYPRLRQVMFERMWAGFRAGRLDIALGAIGAQQSSYFSTVIEPETYLLKVYIFKKLCRDEDIKELRKEVDDIKAKLDNPKIDFFSEWAMSDIEFQALMNLTKINPTASSQGSIKPLERRKEIDAILLALRKKYEYDRERIRKDLEQLIAYSYVALGTKDFSFIKQQEFDRAALMENGDEIWPAMDAEDWIDEMGGHIYIGESLCKKEG